MYLRYSEVTLSVSLLLVFISIVSIWCESQTLNTEGEEIVAKLRPLKYSPINGCNEFCQNIICETIKKCTNGTIVKEGSYCNCCDACIEYLDIGQHCKNIKGSLALGGQSTCKPGSKCQNGKCELDDSVNGCLRQREKRLNLQGKKKFAKNIWIPQCDEEGNYKGKQKKIRKSICVDESGTRIFGNAEDSRDSTCACSRHMQKKEKDNEYNVNPQEHCSPSGNFDTLQCINGLCYCADDETGQVKSPLVKLDFLDKLHCYDSNQHTQGYMKNCEIELQRSKKLSYEFFLKGVKLRGIDRIKCDPDGSYSPTQCWPNRCVCTDKEGVGIGSYAMEKRDAVKLNMVCNCARYENSMMLASPFTCLGNGNYDLFTCFDDDCICVDEDGDHISIEIKESDTDIEELCQELRKITNLNKIYDENITDDTTEPDEKVITDETTEPDDSYYDYYSI